MTGKSKSIKHAIDILGELNDRRLDARARGDKAELLRIAAAYRELNCPRMAAECEKDAGQ